MKRSVRIKITIVAVIIVAALVVVANILRAKSQVRDVDVVVKYHKMPALVSEKAIKDTILAAMPQLLQQQVKTVDTKRVEEVASRVPYIHNVDVSVSVGRKVVVKADQRVPIARLYYKNMEAYIGQEGEIFPVSSLGNCDLLVVSGDFMGNKPLSCTDSTDMMLLDAYTLCSYIKKDKMLTNIIDQVFIHRNRTATLVPKLGPIIDFGRVEDVEKKIENLFIFYTQGIPESGWNKYSRISLAYDSQVVATKRNK